MKVSMVKLQKYAEIHAMQPISLQRDQHQFGI
jgi:hypothetical protein